ncbi:MAG: hypothetical protein GQ542_02695 [Desulforhopalus sp.]|nr:hypothetical protein [Desulforhopalus sp.]
MKASYKNFMTGLIDYAGFFPPADLDIETVVGNYAGYLRGENGWMLGRCIIPATQLNRVVLHPGFRCSVIVSPDVPQEEIDQLSSFKGHVEMVETRLPENATSPAGCMDQLLHLHSRLLKAGLQDVQLFVEAESVVPIALQIATFSPSQIGGKVIKNVGYKLRCGGLTKQAFPSPEKVADAISICCEHEIPVKFTAGMHHSLRNHSPELMVMQHGFINIFGASLLYWNGNLSRNEITECLRDEAAHHFHFTEENFSWREKIISASEISRLRQSKVISFGSCSFIEPVEGLNSLGLNGNTGA